MSFGRITKLHVNIAKCQTRITYANGASRLLTNNPSGFAFRSMGDTSCHCPGDSSTRARYFLHRHFGKRGSIERTSSLEQLMLALDLDFTADDEAEELRLLEEQQQRVEQGKQVEQDKKEEKEQPLVPLQESPEISQEASEVEQLLLQESEKDHVLDEADPIVLLRSDHKVRLKSETSELLMLLESETQSKREPKKSSEHESELDSDKSFEQKSQQLWAMESKPMSEQKTADLLMLEPESVMNSQQDSEESSERELNQAMAERNFVKSDPDFALKSPKSENVLMLGTNKVSEEALEQTLEESWKEQILKKPRESTRNPKLKSVKSEQLLVLKSELFLRQKPEPMSDQVSSSKTERELKQDTPLQMPLKRKMEQQQEQRSVPEPKVEYTWYLEKLPETLPQRATMKVWHKENLKLSNCARHLKHCQARTAKCKCQCISKTVERINELTRASLSEPAVNKDSKQRQKNPMNSRMKANLVSLNGLLLQLGELLEQ